MEGIILGGKTHPFKILIAEMMLQRTKADQVLPVYVQFISKWKDAESLNSAHINEISGVFAKLGLPWHKKESEKAELFRKIEPYLTKRRERVEGVGGRENDKQGFLRC